MRAVFARVSAQITARFIREGSQLVSGPLPFNFINKIVEIAVGDGQPRNES
jgi:hypothetical protein